MGSPITTHILDTAMGKPAQGVAISLARRGADDSFIEIANGHTDADGRIADLLAPDALTEGVYRMHFDTGAYFAATNTPNFYPYVEVVFSISAPNEHYHVPLLLNPYGYSTYRGS